VTEGDTPAAYVIAHVREALATDARVAELGIELTIAAGTLVLTGRVGSEELRAAAADVAAAHADGLEVRNDLDVVEGDAPPAAPEVLA
jgi:osmotically-inducible protein OsmY